MDLVNGTLVLFTPHYSVGGRTEDSIGVSGSERPPSHLKNYLMAKSRFWSVPSK